MLTIKWIQQVSKIAIISFHWNFLGIKDLSKCKYLFECGNIWPEIPYLCAKLFYGLPLLSFRLWIRLVFSLASYTDMVHIGYRSLHPESEVSFSIYFWKTRGMICLKILFKCGVWKKLSITLKNLSNLKIDWWEREGRDMGTYILSG